MKQIARSVQHGLVVGILLTLPTLVSAEESITITAPPSSLTLRTSEAPSLLGNARLSSGATNNVFSEPPSVTGRYTVHGSTVMPYIGLGFGGGETTDVNRTVTRESTLRSAVQQDRLLNDSLGKSLAPNEVQLGIRIPF